MFVDSHVRKAVDLKGNVLNFPDEFAQPDSFLLKTTRKIGVSLYDPELRLAAQVGNVMLLQPSSHRIEDGQSNWQDVYEVPLPNINGETNTRVKLWSTEAQWGNRWSGKVGRSSSGARWKKLTDATWELELDSNDRAVGITDTFYRWKHENTTFDPPTVVPHGQSSFNVHLSAQLDEGTTIRLEAQPAKLLFDEQVSANKVIPKPTVQSQAKPRVEFLGVLPCEKSHGAWRPMNRGWTREGVYEPAGEPGSYTGLGTSGTPDFVYVDFRFRDIPAHATIRIGQSNTKFGFGTMSGKSASLDGDGVIYSVMVDRTKMPKLVDLEARIADGAWAFKESVTEQFPGKYTSQPPGTISVETHRLPSYSSQRIWAKVAMPAKPIDLKGRFYNRLGQEEMVFGSSRMPDGVGMSRTVKALDIPITKVDIYQRPITTLSIPRVPMFSPLAP